MARAPADSDVFNAVAEPRRRAILEVLDDGERSVGELVDLLGLSQPQVSKHLKVLHAVDLVRSRAAGRQRRYRINGEALRPIAAWASTFERHWNQRLDQLDDLLAELQEGRRREHHQEESP